MANGTSMSPGRRALRWLAAAVGLIVSSSCQPEPRSQDVFVFARGSDAQRLDPADVDDGESVNTLMQIFEGLVRFESGTLEIEPALAEEYWISDDGLTYTFRLREGVIFHDGTPLNAETALFTFHRQMDPGHPGHLPGADFQYWSYLYQEIEEVTATGPMTIEFRLSEPNASLLHSQAIFPAALVSPQALEDHGTDLRHHPVGTGPYRFVRWSRNESIVLERNPDYWGEPPGFEGLIFWVVPENTTRLLELRTGQVHGLDGLQPAEADSLEGDERFKVYRSPGLNVGYLTFSGFAERLAEPEIREAIFMAIDRERLVEVALDGAGTVADYPVPPGFLGYPVDPERTPHDPDRAREILSRYAHRWDRPVVLSVMNAPRQYFPDSVRAASLIRSDLRRVGIEIEVNVRDFGSHLDRLYHGDYEMALIGWIGDNGDPDNFLSIFFGSWAAEMGSASNFAFYIDDEMDDLLRSGRRATDPEIRHEIYAEALGLWRRDLPILPLVHGDNIVVLRSEIEGFELQKTGDLRFGRVRWREE